MAITHNGTKNLLPKNNLPKAYSQSAIVGITDFHYTRELTISVPKATVEKATSAATMAAIIDDATVGIDFQIEAILALDFLATATVSSSAELIAITHNIASLNGDSDTFKNVPTSYACTVKLYVKAL